MLQMWLDKIFIMINGILHFSQKKAESNLQSNQLFDIKQSILKSQYWRQ